MPLKKSPSLYVIPFTLLHINIKAVIEILARPSGLGHRERGGLRIDRILSYETNSNELSFDILFFAFEFYIISTNSESH